MTNLNYPFCEWVFVLPNGYRTITKFPDSFRTTNRQGFRTINHRGIIVLLDVEFKGVSLTESLH